MENIMVKTKVTLILLFISLIIAWQLGSEIVETVPKGKYHIKQAAVSGEMTAYMKPGMYPQMFGDVQEWPKAETFYFTSDPEEGGSEDTSIKVRFVDGSDTGISGTMRLILPTTEQDAINLITQHGYTSYKEVEHKLILPTVRKALIITANLMTARESYAEKRNDFFYLASDQIENGMYLTEDYEKEIIDPTDPEGKKRIFVNAKRPRVDKKGNVLREKEHLLYGTGIRIANFEVKQFDYPDRVEKQIAQQQENLMAIATARSLAERAKQDTVTAEEKGKANVMTAKYTEEVEKIKKVVVAQREKEVAETHAQKELEVQKLLKLAAREEKQRLILLGEGESTRKKLVMNADGALEKKLEAWVAVNANYATALEKNAQKLVPNIVMGADSKKGNVSPVTDFMDLIKIKTANDLQLDMSMRGQSKK